MSNFYSYQMYVSLIKHILLIILITRRVCRSQVTSSVAGTGSFTRCTVGTNCIVSGVAANSLSMSPLDAFATTDGVLYISDYDNYRILRVTNGLTRTIAGNGQNVASTVADGGPGTSTSIQPTVIVADTSGTVYFGDICRIRTLTPSTYLMNTYSGRYNNSACGTPGEGVLARVNPMLNFIDGLFLTTSGDLYYSTISGNCKVQKITAAGYVYTILGTGTCATSASTSGNALLTSVHWPTKIWVTSSNDLYVAERYSHVIRKVVGGIQTVIAGTPGITSNNLNQPWGLYLDSSGMIYFTNFVGNSIQRLSPAGIITLVSTMTGPTAIFPDTMGFTYIVSYSTYQVNKVSPNPTSQPSTTPSLQPASEPSNQPSRRPSRQPSRQPSNQPTRRPSVQPNQEPSSQPSRQPGIQPTMQPSVQPTVQPSRQPSNQPTIQPSLQPVDYPTSRPSMQPSRQPSRQPYLYPTTQPSQQPTTQPSRRPSSQPTLQPSILPSRQPTFQPSRHPSNQPSLQPSIQPICHPTNQPTNQPTRQPNRHPSSQPSLQPSIQPSRQPTSQPTIQPTRQPSRRPSGRPSLQPSIQPSNRPTSQPTKQPTTQPSHHPSSQPTMQPSIQPSKRPSGQPTIDPTAQPTQQPSSQPSRYPSNQPGAKPSMQPSRQPSAQPSTQPSSYPSRQPTIQPTNQPSWQPSKQPTLQPNTIPTSQPSVNPSKQPSEQPSNIPSHRPISEPSSYPSNQPSNEPSVHPSNDPSSQPSDIPTSQPSRQPSFQPVNYPSKTPSKQPTSQPLINPSTQPTANPSQQPFLKPTSRPSVTPTVVPSNKPTTQPSIKPSYQITEAPTRHPSSQPSTYPSIQPSLQPSTSPSSLPSSHPTTSPSLQPSLQPLSSPSKQPLSKPSTKPSLRPSQQPSTMPSVSPSNQPLIKPSSMPSAQPSFIPSRQPTIAPSAQPSGLPSSDPSSLPTLQPYSQPSRQPSNCPSIQPSCYPTRQPSAHPSSTPSLQPSNQPTIEPSSFPTLQPFRKPTSQPSILPSAEPTRIPTMQNTQLPSCQPSMQPQTQPSFQPRSNPSVSPTGQPSCTPTLSPSATPSMQPTCHPTVQPSIAPSTKPTTQPVATPTCQPSNRPSSQPSQAPSNPSSQPTTTPTLPTSLPTALSSSYPTDQPTGRPTCQPLMNPSSLPTTQPKSLPTVLPSYQPTTIPSTQLSGNPSRQPNLAPSAYPSVQPSDSPSSKPSQCPSFSPSLQPMTMPSSQPSTCPSFSPSEKPTIQPTIQPTKQPNFNPSSQPSSLPSLKPSMQPSSTPTNPTSQPSSRPTSPTGQPSSNPSSPTSQPSQKPSLQPSSLPSTKPSSQPTARPTFQPFGAPSGAPSQQPTSRPSLQPRSDPTVSPSNQPTRQPSHQPVSSPTSQPTTMPTIDGARCELGTFYFPDQNICQQCPNGSSTSAMGLLTCTCNNGYRQFGIGNELTCTICPAGYFSKAGNSNCSICPMGYYSSPASAECIACPVGYYSSTNASSSCLPCSSGKYAPYKSSSTCLDCQAGTYSPSLASSVCLSCPQGAYCAGSALSSFTTCKPGQVTPGSGSTSPNECVSPKVNFIAGYICICIATGLGLIYIVFARFERISFQRREAYVVPNLQRCLQIDRELRSEISKMESTKFDKLLSSYQKVLIFSLAALVAILGSIFISFLSILNRTVFNLVILWRGMKLGDVAVLFNQLVEMLSTFFAVLSFPLKVLSVLKVAFYPFLVVYTWFSSLNLSSFYNLLSVTCEGAKSPIELFVNCFVLGIVITFIKANYTLLWVVTLQDLNKALVLKLSMSTTGWSIFSIHGVLCLFAMIATTLNPFMTVLRFSLSIVNYSAFFMRDHAMHEISAACIAIAGYHGHELILVYLTSLVVWLLIPPMIYAMAEVLCPAGGQELLLQYSNEYFRNKTRITAGYNDVLPGHVGSRGVADHDLTPANIDTAAAADSHDGRNSREIEAGEEPSPSATTGKSSPYQVSFSYSAYVYIASWFHLLFSTDLLIAAIMSVWINYTERLHRIDKKRSLRSQDRWNSRQALTQQSMETFQSRLTKGKVQSSIDYIKDFARESSQREALIELKWKKHQLIQTLLPSYYALVCMELSELQRTAFELFRIPSAVSMFLCVPLLLLGLGHVVTRVGRCYFFVVAKKYAFFFCVCLGIWTDEIFAAYEIDSLMNSASNDEREVVVLKFMYISVSTRAILLQALGSFPTLVSVVIVGLSGSPLFCCFSQRLQRLIPPLICWNAREKALEREQREEVGFIAAVSNAAGVAGAAGGDDDSREEERRTMSHSSRSTRAEVWRDVHVEEWVLKLRTLHVLASESRIVMFCANLLITIFILVFIFDFPSSMYEAVVSFCILIPYLLALSMRSVIYTGKIIGLSDRDFAAVGMSWFVRRSSKSNKVQSDHDALIIHERDGPDAAVTAVKGSAIAVAVAAHIDDSSATAHNREQEHGKHQGEDAEKDDLLLAEDKSESIPTTDKAKFAAAEEQRAPSFLLPAATAEERIVTEVDNNNNNNNMDGDDDYVSLSFDSFHSGSGSFAEEGEEGEEWEGEEEGEEDDDIGSEGSFLLGLLHELEENAVSSSVSSEFYDLLLLEGDKSIAEESHESSSDDSSGWKSICN